MEIKFTKQARKDYERCPHHIQSMLTRWVNAIVEYGIRQTREEKGFHDEPLKGKLKGLRSVRLNRQWRVIYSEETGELLEIRRITPPMTTDFNEKETYSLEEVLGSGWRDKHIDLSQVGCLTSQRIARGWSLTELSLRAGLPVQRISEFEKKRRNPTIKQMYKWADALEMDTPAILLAYIAERLQASGIDTHWISERYQLNDSAPQQPKTE
jgi:toxin HigB-1